MREGNKETAEEPLIQLSQQKKLFAAPLQVNDKTRMIPGMESENPESYYSSRQDWNEPEDSIESPSPTSRSGSYIHQQPQQKYQAESPWTSVSKPIEAREKSHLQIKPILKGTEFGGTNLAQTLHLLSKRQASHDTIPGIPPIPPPNLPGAPPIPINQPRAPPTPKLDLKSPYILPQPSNKPAFPLPGQSAVSPQLNQISVPPQDLPSAPSTFPGIPALHLPKDSSLSNQFGVLPTLPPLKFELWNAHELPQLFNFPAFHTPAQPAAIPQPPQIPVLPQQTSQPHLPPPIAPALPALGLPLQSGDSGKTSGIPTPPLPGLAAAPTPPRLTL